MNVKKSISIPLRNIKIEDKFWSKYVKLVHEVVIPYQWEVINDRIPGAEPSHAIKNFRIAAGLEQGEFYGLVFQDTDLAKWLEAVAYRLETHPDSELEKLADEAIELIANAQQPDGYLNTYYTIKEPGKRWTNLRECHELYTAGHMIEAAVAYYMSTGKRKLLDAMCRFADHIDNVFGTDPCKIRGYDGHQEIELALIKLYKITGEEKYLKLSKYFLDERGKEPYYFDIESEKRGNTVHFQGFVMYNRKYAQTHLPVREQTTIEGHAVRAVYMLTAMADVAGLIGDEELLTACHKLWNSIVTKRMYITGGIGSMAFGESFSFDYDLPNDTMYTETCASIGLIFFAQRMLEIEPNSNYADEMERALYNNVLAGIAQDGKSFFYVNPLEILPEACEKNATYKHVKPVRQKWFACACCPPNIARLLSSLGQYIYTVIENTIFTHLYIESSTKIETIGSQVTLKQKTNYPWDGKITLTVFIKEEKEITVAVRIPGWCKKYCLKLNGMDIDTEIVSGYAMIKRTWSNGDSIELILDMPVELMKANPAIRNNIGKVTIQRGPLIYCLEEIDNGSNLSGISIPFCNEFTEEYDEKLFGGAIVIRGEAFRIDVSTWDDQLYSTIEVNEMPTFLKAIPYYMWGNRKSGEMAVWIRQR